MAKRNTTVSRQDIIVVLDLYEEIIAEQLYTGNSVSTSFFNAYMGIKGWFGSDEEDFTQGKQELKMSMSMNPRFKKRLRPANIDGFKAVK